MMKPRSKGRKHWLSEKGDFRIEKGVFLLRLESVRTVCFVGVTAISNRIQLRLEIGFEGLGKAGWDATGGRNEEPLRRCIETSAYSKAVTILPQR
jgi:hypothetical protein